MVVLTNKLMAGCIVLFFSFMAVIEARTVAQKITDFGRSMPQTIVQCRSACLTEYLLPGDEKQMPEICSSKPNCFMCWDLCKVMQINGDDFSQRLCRNQHCVSVKRKYI